MGITCVAETQRRTVIILSRVAAFHGSCHGSWQNAADVSSAADLGVPD